MRVESVALRREMPDGESARSASVAVGVEML